MQFDTRIGSYKAEKLLCNFKVLFTLISTLLYILFATFLLNTPLDRDIFTEMRIDIFGWGLEDKRNEFY